MCWQVPFLIRRLTWLLWIPLPLPRSWCFPSPSQKNIMVATRNKDYGNSSPSIGHDTDQPANSTISPLDPTPNVIPTELTIKPPKGVIHKSTINPHLRATQNYNIVEDLAQAPSAMSTLEVLENCPTQKKALLSVIGCIDPSNFNLLVFNHENHMPWLPSQLNFVI